MNEKKVPIGLNSLKSKVDKLNVHKLKPAATDLKKSSQVVDKQVVKNICMMNWLKN